MRNNSPHTFCRTCLNEFQQQQPTYNIQTMDFQIRQWLQDSTLQNPLINDTFPKFVCHLCRDKLESFLEFHKMSLRSRQLFEEMMDKKSRIQKHSIQTQEIKDVNVSAGQHCNDGEVNCDWLEFDFVAIPKSLTESQKEAGKEEIPVGKEELCSATSPKKDVSIDSYEPDDECSHSQDSDLQQDEMDRNVSNSRVCKAKITPKKSTKLKSKRKSAMEQKPHIEEKPQHVCEECGKIYPSFARLTEHQYSHKPKEEYPFHCNKCSKTFKHRQTFNAHQLRHAGIKNHQCPYCDMKKTTKSELRAHINHHTKERQWLCPKCPLIFTSAANLRRHDQVVHQGIRRYSCNYCDQTFGKQESLKHHEMRHTGEKPHACTECDKRFIQLVALKAHMKTHNNKYIT